MKEMEIVVYEMESPEGYPLILRVKLDKQSPFSTMTKSSLDSLILLYLDSGQFDQVKLVNKTKNTVIRYSK